MGKQNGSFLGPFTTKAHCHLFNIHGGLHLFEDESGQIEKATNEGVGVIATIAKAIVEQGRFPVYVAEGTSDQKMKKINSVAYLRHCYDILKRNTAAMFVYGHSAGANDAHIYRAIFESGTKHVFFGVYKPNEEKVHILDGLLANYQRSVGSSTEYTFFDSESAKVWDA